MAAKSDPNTEYLQVLKSYQTLLLEVKELRRLQKQYFSMRYASKGQKADTLNLSKAQESKVDRIITCRLPKIESKIQEFVQPQLAL